MIKKKKTIFLQLIDLNTNISKEKKKNERFSAFSELIEREKLLQTKGRNMLETLYNVYI